MNKKMNRTTIGLLAMIPCILWASVFPVVKLLLEELSITTDTPGKITIAGMRFFTAGVIILIYATIKNKDFPVPEKKAWGNILLVGMFQTFGLYSLYYISMAFVTGVKASVISQGGIFYLIILAYFILDERVKRNQWIGIFFGILGIIAINVNRISGDTNFFTFTFQGEGLLMLSGVFGSIGQILAKKRCTSVAPMTLNGWQMTLGGGVLLVFGIILNGGIVPLTSVFSIFLMLYSVMVAAVGFTVWYYLLQNVNVSEIVPFRLTIPVLGSMFSAIFLPGENISVNIIVGLLFVLFGMYITRLPDKI
ncbi:MAG: DMT family transporter [Clostridiaceae bacterium]